MQEPLTPPPDGLISAMLIFGAAVAGRLLFHVQLVVKGERKFFSKKMLFELVTAAGMGIIAGGTAEYLDLTGSPSWAFIALVSYIGPYGIDKLANRLLDIYLRKRP